MNYDVIEKIVNSQKIGHAYLIECQNSDVAINFALTFAKKILSLGLDDQEASVINLQIENNVHPDLAVVYPENRQIKKGVICALQQKFNKKSYTSNKRVYIIYNCEFLNKEATNSMLKFLEEPTTDLIAILTTSNINKVYDTIKSRCQIINISNTNRDNIYEILKGINVLYSQILDEDKTFIDKVCNFVDMLEQVGCEIIAENSEWYKVLSDKNTFSLFFDTLYYIYYDIINIQTSRKMLFFEKKINTKRLLNKNLNIFIEKVNIIVKYKKLVENNINVANLLDKFIIDMERVDTVDRSCRS